MRLLKVGIAGLGTIGRVVGSALDVGIEGLELVAVTSGDQARARARVAQYRRPVEVVDTAGLAARADVVVDCAPTSAFLDIATATLHAGRTLLTVSGAALLEQPQVIELARAHGGRIILATGALLGFDAVRAAAEGTIHSVRIVTRKPPQSLASAAYVRTHHIALDDLREPLLLFDGTARDGAARFPANVNVAAALALAGIGPDRTQLQIWADPSLTRNTHNITVDADSARFEMQIENIPTLENPGTGRITALSVIAALRSLTAPLRVGT